MKSQLLLALCGGGLVAVAGACGGWSAAIGGAAALAAQSGAVALLRPAMSAPIREFMARWLAGMAIRVALVIAVLAYAATHRSRLDLLAASLGSLGVLLPLLMVETKFLR